MSGGAGGGRREGGRRDVLVRGAGPAGAGAALELAERGLDVEVVERAPVPGGNAGSFEVAGVRVDFGSHRLHPRADPAVLARLRDLLGDELRVRPRHGRIRLAGRWIHFPLQPLDLLRNAPPRFALGVLVDALRPRRAGAGDSFAEVLEAGLGPTICREFYFPYARKIWGLEPEAISPVQAERRVSASSLAEVLRRLLPGGGGGGSRRVFYYPRGGFGRISEALAGAAVAAGARLSLGTRAEEVRRVGDGWEVVARRGDEVAVLAGRHLFSTVPAARLVTLLRPAPPAAVVEAAGRLVSRAMVLVYPIVERDRYTEFDAHYFPGPEVPVTRLSEPKRYAGREEPRGRTVLCAELPCARGDELWTAGDDELGRIVSESLERAGLPRPEPLAGVEVRRLPHAYPVYRRGFEAAFAAVDGYLSALPDLLTFGRQGLFAHDNTHHALVMARAAAECLGDDLELDRGRWAGYRREFEEHVVED